MLPLENAIFVGDKYVPTILSTLLKNFIVDERTKGPTCICVVYFCVYFNVATGII